MLCLFPVDCEADAVEPRQILDLYLVEDFPTLDKPDPQQKNRSRAEDMKPGKGVIPAGAGRGEDFPGEYLHRE